MNKWISLMLGCAIAGSTVANAQSNWKINTKKFPTVIENRGAMAPAKAPNKVVNDEKDLGTKMWAVDNLAYDKDPGFVYFYDTNTSTLNKTGIIKPYDKDDQRRWNMSAATYHNGKYLGYLYYRYDMGFNYVKDFVEVDLEKGTYKSLRDMSAMEGKWNYMEAMTSNPKTGQLIGLGRDMGGAVSSGIFEINPETGEYKEIFDLSEYYYTIAYDREGTLWALRWKFNPANEIIGTYIMTLDEKNGYKETNVKELTKNGKAAILYGQSQNCLYFHPKTGVLYAGANEVANNNVVSYICTINTETGEIENASKFGWAGNDSVTGLYIPGTAPDSVEGANMATEISSTYDENGLVTLSWTNPTTTASNGELKELAEVRIYRDGEKDENLVETIKTGVTVGGKMTWTDKNAPEGLHEYFIVPCRVAGEKGVSDSWKAFSGKDTPGMPQNVKINKTDRTVIDLSWEAAAHGANDGWYDKANTTYTIVRHPDEVEVATGVKSTSYTDKTIGDVNTYSYTIYGVTAAGKGTGADSESVMAGSAYQTPYETNLESEADALQWTVVDNNNDGNRFNYDTINKPVGFYMNASSQNDDYVVSPDIRLFKGKEYKVKMNVYYAYPPTDYDPEFCNSMRITAGKGRTAADQTIVVYENDKLQTELGKYYQTIVVEGTFTADSDGEWNIAFHNNTNKQDYSQDLRFCGMTIYEILDNDIAAIGINGTVNPAKNTASDYTVQVKNIGKKAAASYKVQVVRLAGDKQIVIGETTVNEALEPEATKEVVVSATPDVVGEAEFAGKVILSDDMDNSNDTSATLAVEIAPEGTVPFNAIVTNDFESGSTRCGISFKNFHSHMQSYYHPEDFGDYIKPDEKITIHRLALEYNSNAVVEDFELTVYLGDSDIATVGGDLKWLDLQDLTMVYYADGLSTLPGDGNTLVLDFDTPFEHDTNKNLVVAFVKNGLCEGNEFPTIWKTFNDDWNATEYRTIRFENGTEDTPIAGESGNVIADLPYLNLAISKDDPSGIENITLGGNSNIEYANGVISFNGINVASVEVYDVAGRTIVNRAFVGDAVSVALENGIYVVKATDLDGKVYTQKISADK